MTIRYVVESVNDEVCKVVHLYDGYGKEVELKDNALSMVFEMPNGDVFSCEVVPEGLYAVH